MTEADPGNPSRLGAVATGSSTLRMLPVQLVETAEGVIVKRGVTLFGVSGEGAANIVYRVLEAVTEGVGREEIKYSFAEPDREVVDDLIAHLVARRFLVPKSGEPGEHDVEVAETPLDVFYWNFRARTEIVAGRVNARRLTVLGVNEISRRLVGALGAAGVTDVDVVDFHLLRNVGLFEDTGMMVADRWADPVHLPVSYEEWSERVDEGPPGCIVATSDFGATPAIREWNRFCIDNGWHFLPVILQDLVGYIGPLVIPGQGACYECLRARQNSHMEDPVSRRTAEQAAFEGQRLHGFHPSMASVLGDIAAMELMKFYGGLPLSRMGTLIEVNLMGPSLIARKVLKVPRCTVCSTMRTQVAPTLDTSIYRLND
jgi:molybdopterin-synthase adenylyltransferase